MSIITLTTDFGSVYPAAMKGVILSIDPRATIVDISHTVPRGDIRAGAFALYSAVPYFPVGSVHVAVVDPGVGTARDSIVISSGGHLFVGPDNGLMIPAASMFGKAEIRKITNSDLLGSISATFHGRDVFARIGAYLSKGLPLEEVGEPTMDHVHMDFGVVETGKDFISGKVVYIDDFGNIITNIKSSDILGTIGFGETVHIFSRDMPLMRTYALVDEGELLALVGSHGFLEIALNKGDASKKLDILCNDPVKLTFLKK
ncbi:MAG: SAM-dependent chlorinase/fluorinase [Methanomethylovorans sp.]|uniref:SAM hydrolase/SAM-dependent halogenase family protein n=1 Tax=Methanomethylovorans sp. TaxID=2758717 RepID=UPI000A8004D5|nr:SAM-dependent chlorinase/fluorinase [Methanomethylovorans sp.]